jgi:hypothetical protein
VLSIRSGQAASRELWANALAKRRDGEFSQQVRLNHRYIQGNGRRAAMPSSAPKIHVSLPGDLHKRLRVKVALEDTTIQEYVENLVAQAVRRVKLPEDA